jgi:hypothetical protein
MEEVLTSNSTNINTTLSQPKSKFKFTQKKQVEEKKSHEDKENDNFNIEELKNYYNIFMNKYNSKIYQFLQIIRNSR